MKIAGNLVDVSAEEIYPAEITFKEKILKIKKVNKKYKNFILPGFIDAHIHIDSSMLCPSRFGEVVVPHGTVAVITDPHEIANVMGMDGINYMISDSTTPLKIFFTAPSCVPATPYETSGAILESREIEKLMRYKQVVALGEVMNYPAVICGDKKMITKINIAKKYNKPIDGHCPNLSGKALKKYVSYGISTEHECSTLKEAQEKANLGMQIMIRDGSAAKNMEALINLKQENSFIVSDDKHPIDLTRGHINLMLKKAVSLGMDPIKAIKKVTLNPAQHYKLNFGLIEPGKDANLIEVDDLKNFNVKRVTIDGKLVARNGKPLFKVKPKLAPLNIKIKQKEPQDFDIVCKKSENKVKVRVIQTVENQLFTKELIRSLNIKNKKILIDIKRDVLKIAVVERYGHEKIALGFIKGFNLKKGAIASSIAHDSHNIVVIGTNEEDMAKAVNLTAKYGGLVAVCKDKSLHVKLPIAGLMTDKRADVVSVELKKIHDFTRKLGCNLYAPFMAMSFMCLTATPEINITDKGLIDTRNFRFVNVIVK